MHVEIPHKFSQAEAVRRVKTALLEGRSKIKNHATIQKEEWKENTLEFGVDLQGKNITGSLVVEDSKFVLDATLPLMWRMFEGRIERAIEEQVKQLM